MVRIVPNNKKLFITNQLKSNSPINKAKLLKAILKIWNNNPELRLGQLLVNTGSNDLYYVSDEQLLKNLQRYDNQ